MRVKRARIGTHTFSNISEMRVNSEAEVTNAESLPWKWFINDVEVSADTDLVYNFTIPGMYLVQLRSSDPKFAAGVASELIQILNSPPRIVTSALADAQLGVDYLAILEGSDGTAPYTWKGHLLPAGMYLLSNGTLAGVPTVGGNFEFDVDIIDANKELVTKRFSLVIATNPPPEVTGG